MLFHNNDTAIIGIDHGFYNLKTAKCCFPSCFLAYDSEPDYTDNLLVYDKKYYLIGRGHKEFNSDKTADQDYFILTLAGIGAELEHCGKTVSKVYLAAATPLTWTDQKEKFRQYLLQKQHVDFIWNGRAYSVDILDALLFAQGFPALIHDIPHFKGVHVMCDIGGGTMNVLFFNGPRPDPAQQYTEIFGTRHCLMLVREEVSKKLGKTIPDGVIEEVLRNGTADISQEYIDAITEAASVYAEGIMEKLREKGYNPDLMRLEIVGGGGCLIRHFGQYDKARTAIHDEINAAAKGFETMALTVLTARDKNLRNGDAK